MKTLDTMQLAITMKKTMGLFWLIGLMPLKSLSMNVMGGRLLGNGLSTQLMLISWITWRWHCWDWQDYPPLENLPAMVLITPQICWASSFSCSCRGHCSCLVGDTFVSLYLLFFPFFNWHRDFCVVPLGVIKVLLLLGDCQASSWIGLDIQPAWAL